MCCVSYEPCRIAAGPHPRLQSSTYLPKHPTIWGYPLRTRRPFLDLSIHLLLTRHSLELVPIRDNHYRKSLNSAFQPLSVSPHWQINLICAITCLAPLEHTPCLRLTATYINQYKKLDTLNEIALLPASMTTGILTTQMYTPPPGSQTQLYGAQQPSPSNSSSGTPMTASPTSPQNFVLYHELPLHTKQLRPLKSPMYVPAVLRPTERPPRQTLTPPRSVHGSLESLDGIAQTLSRRSTGDFKNQEGSEDVVEEETVEDINLPEVTGLPTKEHWKPDANAVICDAPICQKSFSLFERRHHCRRCGHVFCNSHSHFMIPLDQDAEFHPDGAPSRGCKHCWNLYCNWEASIRSRSNSTSSAATTTPVMPMIGSGKGGPLAPEATKTTVSSSVPRDWNWSTF